MQSAANKEGTMNDHDDSLDTAMGIAIAICMSVVFWIGVVVLVASMKGD